LIISAGAIWGSQLAIPLCEDKGILKKLTISRQLIFIFNIKRGLIPLTLKQADERGDIPQESTLKLVTKIHSGYPRERQILMHGRRVTFQDKFLIPPC
jgi:hypothetical protein